MINNNDEVKKIINENKKVKNKLLHSINAFFIGGALALIGQGIFELIKSNSNLETTIINKIVSTIFVVIAFLLTIIGIYDKFSKISGAGLFIPITGFSNSITSSALEGRSEGLIFGIGAKMFSLIGSVCTYGVVSSIIFGFIYYLIKVINHA